MTLLILMRLYRFHRRSGFSRRMAFSRALDSVRRDLTFNRGVSKR
jgi:hypothetical protein